MSDVNSKSENAERLRISGPEFLSSAELLSVVEDKDVKELESQLPKDILSGKVDIFSLTKNELQQAGFSGSVIDTVIALREFTVRARKESYIGMKIGSPGDICKILRDDTRGQKQEHLWAVLLTKRCKVISIEEISIGTTDSTYAEPKDIFRPAIAKGAGAIAIVHNHPSGDIEPSVPDMRMTQSVMRAGKVLDIELMDSLIISGDGNNYVSFKQSYPDILLGDIEDIFRRESVTAGEIRNGNPESERPVPPPRRGR